jgi:hypothetical protein
LTFHIDLFGQHHIPRQGQNEEQENKEARKKMRG